MCTAHIGISECCSLTVRPTAEEHSNLNLFWTYLPFSYRNIRLFILVIIRFIQRIQVRKKVQNKKTTVCSLKLEHWVKLKLWLVQVRTRPQCLASPFSIENLYHSDFFQRQVWRKGLSVELRILIQTKNSDLTDAFITWNNVGNQQLCLQMQVADASWNFQL